MLIERNVINLRSLKIWPQVITTNLQPPPNNVARRQNNPSPRIAKVFLQTCFFLYLQKGSRFSASFGVGNYCIFSAHTVLILQYVYLMDRSCYKELVYLLFAIFSRKTFCPSEVPTQKKSFFNLHNQEIVHKDFLICEQI